MRGQEPKKQAPPDRTTLDVTLGATWVRGAGYHYDVLLEDDLAVRQSRDPEHGTARELQARGFTGTFRTIDAVSGKPRMVLDIGKAAGLRTVERDRSGLAVEPTCRCQPTT